MEIIPYGLHQITDEDIAAVVRVLKTAPLTQGPEVLNFELQFSKYLQSLATEPDEVFSVAVNNGTTALHLCCLALGVQPGDRVIVTSNSFVATSNCVLYVGGEVDLADISDEDFCLDSQQVEKLIASKPKGTYKGIIAVDFAGHPADLKSLHAIAKHEGLWLIEDACHALGAVTIESNGQRIPSGGGKYSDLSVFSFHPVKHIATGEGGMITTRSRELFEKLKKFRTHGITKDPSKLSKVDGPWYYEMQELGHNGRISDVLCALGASQLSRIEQNIVNRRKIAARYQEALADLPIQLPKCPPTIEHAFHLYVIRTKERKALYDFLYRQGIHTQVHYIPIHQQPYYVNRYGPKKLEVCDRYYQECLSLPMFHSLSVEKQDFVIQKIKEFFKSK